MKKIQILLIVFAFILLCGCSSTKVDKKIDKNKELYLKYVKELQKVKKSSDEEIPFDINVDYDKLTDEEVRFQVILDNPKEEIKDVTAVGIHNLPTNDIFPSTGIFEVKQNLIPNKKPSGIILVGYIPYEGKIKDLKCEVKVLVTYKLNNKKHKVYYVTKKTK